jgi:hypothetical protein
MLNAFCRVAPSDRSNFLAILPAEVFLRAMVFISRTWTGKREYLRQLGVIWGMSDKVAMVTIVGFSYAGIIDDEKRPMKMLAYILAIVCTIAAVMYCVMQGGSLPTFMPGYMAGSTHIRTLHADAAATAAVILFLIGLARR